MWTDESLFPWYPSIMVRIHDSIYFFFSKGKKRLGGTAHSVIIMGWHGYGYGNGDGGGRHRKPSRRSRILCVLQRAWVSAFTHDIMVGI